MMLKIKTKYVGMVGKLSPESALLPAVNRLIPASAFWH
jgi:hypothetical protein